MFASTRLSKDEHKSTTSTKGTEGKIDVAAIRANGAKYGKRLLKILTKMDPVLFGPRYVGKKQRSYSGLCQKKKQRPIPITENEYNELMKIPELKQSITRIQNQTFSDQKICLFCADKTFNFLNYHHFPNQKCIVRCTSKSSNKTQYEYCTNELNTDNKVVITNKYENQTITLYNVLISKGRKCKLPEELKNILSNYILIKLEEDKRIDQYCMTNYNKHAFILQREIVNTQQITVCDKYSILTDYSNEFDYVLVLKSESDQNYFLFINEGNNKPLILSEHQEILNFFISHLKQTNDNNNLVRYI